MLTFLIAAAVKGKLKVAAKGTTAKYVDTLSKFI
jgi:hypothetical protein